MLTISDGIAQSRSRLARRDFLRVGTLGLGGLSLANLMRLDAQGAGKSPGFVRDKAVVVLNLRGAASQIETFDPKLTAPSEFRAMFGETPTRLPGITFGHHFPKLAALAHRLAVVRNYQIGQTAHIPASKFTMAGGNSTGAQMGVLYAHLAGANSPRNGMPSNIVLPPRVCGKQFEHHAGDSDSAIEYVTQVGILSSAFKPFDPSGGGQVIDDMRLNVTPERLAQRRALLSKLDNFQRAADRSTLAQADPFQQQAFDVILGGMKEAFNLEREDPRTLARYDTSEYKLSSSVLQKYSAIVAGQQPIPLGKQMLLARRLIEADCRFVTVTSGGWDMHATKDALSIPDGMPTLGPAVDHAVSAFLEDLIERGLFDKTLLVIISEFGRTPRINPLGGREHWGGLCPLVFAGGGLPMGQVIGRSDRTAGVPDGDLVQCSQVLATIMHTLFDVTQLRLADNVPTDILKAITENSPIPQLA